MNHKLNFEEVRDIFIDIEKKYSVYDLEYNKIYYWKLIRMSLYSTIIRKMGFVRESHPLSNSDKIKRLIMLIKYATKNLARKDRIQKSEVLILTHGRKNKINDCYEDIYLYDILNELEESNEKYIIIDRPDHYGKHLGIDKDNLIYFERFQHIIREALYPLFINEINIDKTIDIINNIKKEIKERLGVDIDIERLIKKRIFRFSLEKKYFDNILDKIQPKVIYFVVSYGKEELIASASERNIKTIEMQHGVINNYHMGYYFPFDFNIPYFPDEIILFGSFWEENVQLPRNNKQNVKRFECLKPSYNKNPKNNLNQVSILFISQPTIGDRLSKVALKFMNTNSDEIMVYYKLHPSEFVNWKEKHKELVLCENLGNFKVITDDISIDELFNISNYTIGVNSTAIYESLLRDCKTFILNIEGYQYMEYLIKNNYVKLISEEFKFQDLKYAEVKTLKDKNYFYQ